MLGDVLSAAVAVGETHVVTDDPGAALVAEELGALAVADPAKGRVRRCASGCGG